MRPILLLLVLLFAPSVARALSADELLLIVNKNEPKGMELAKFYAERRKVPDGRIVEIEVPTWNEIEMLQFERNVVPPVRDFLREHKLERQVKCLVTFYGVPLRVNPRAANAAEKKELAAIDARLAVVTQALNDAAAAARRLASELAPEAALQPMPADPVAKAEALLNVAARATASLPPDERDAAVARTFDIFERIGGDVATLKRLRTLGVVPSTRPAGKMSAIELEVELAKAGKDLDEALNRRFDPTSRVIARKIVAERFGLAREFSVLQWQKQFLGPANTQASVDSELPFVLWPSYPRESWLANLLNVSRPKHEGVPYYMVSRIDAPTVELARRMIETSIAVEQQGLAGSVVVDNGFGRDKGGMFKQYDKAMGDLADFIRAKTKLTVVQDAVPGIMPKGTTKDAALYIGWYSLRNYVPPATWSAGAVGYHIASGEMITLHDETEKGWCAGLLRDGAVGTLGPVTEPYLHSFPLPDQFFPLLLTGKLTLAEAYWATNPLSSWVQVLVGDPLYNPYKAKPALAVDDLPSNLKSAITR